MKKVLTVCALVILLACVVGFAAPQSAAPAWEFKVVTQLETNPDKLEASLLTLDGSHGWELVSVERDGHGHRYYFKRAK